MAERDLDAMLRRMSQTKVNRRSFLAAAGLTGRRRGPRGLLRRRDDQRRAECGGAVRRGLERSVRRARPRPRASPPPDRSRKSCSCTTGAEYISTRTTSRRSRPSSASDTFQYDIYDEQRGAARQAPGRRRPATTSRRRRPNTCRAWSRRASSRSSTCRRIPNLKYINPKFKSCGGIRTTSTTSRRTSGRPASCTAAKLVPNAAAVVEGVLRATSRARPRARPSSSTRWATSWSSRSRCSATRSTPSTRRSSRRPARSCSTSPRTSSRSTRTRTATSSRHEEAVVALGWTGPLVQVLATRETADAGYVVPSEGSLFWLDTWVMLADAPHPNASYAWLDFIHRPGDPGRGDELQPATPRRTTRPRSSSIRRSWPTRRSSRPTTSFAKLEGAAGHVGQQPAHRHLGGVQAEDRRLTPTASTGATTR